MAFSVCYDLKGNGEFCDICQLRDEQPTVTLQWRGREGRNIIFAHERCLEKRIARAKARDTAKSMEKG